MATYYGQTVDIWEDFEDGTMAGFTETDPDAIIHPADTTDFHNDGVSSASLEVDLHSYVSTETYLTFAHTAANAVSYGFWYKTGSGYDSWGEGPKIMVVRALLGDNICNMFDQKSNSTGNRAFALYSYNTTLTYYIGDNAVADNTWYWIALQVNVSGTAYWRIYNADHSAFGSEVSFACAATIPDGGYLPDVSAHQACLIYFDDFVIDFTDGSYPLLGWTAGGGAAAPKSISESLGLRSMKGLH